MQDLDDIALLRQYVEHGSEEAFATLVRRHVNQVYSVALRHTGKTHQAEEITQAVFVILAGKACGLNKKVILSGWLYQTARLTAVTQIRGEIRRARREQEAGMQIELNNSETDLWSQIAPLLDTALAGLNETDRHAIVLRFFDGKSMREVAAALGANEDAAKKRVNRAVEKLHGFFLKQGITSTTTTLAGAISARAVQAAPLSLAKTATALAMSKGAAGTASTSTLIHGALKLMAWTKLKTAAGIGVAALLAVGTASITVKQVSHYRELSVWNHITPSADEASRNNHDWQQLQQAPPAVSIRPTKFTPQMAIGQGGGGKILGIHQPFEAALSRAYDISPCRIFPLTPLPAGDFDFVVSGPTPPRNALQMKIADEYGIVGRRETRETDVLELRVKRSDAPGLQPAASSSTSSTSFWAVGHIRRTSGPIRYLANDLEQYLQVPVEDKTGLNGRFDYDLSWDDGIKWDTDGRWHYTNADGLKQLLADQLGLELVPGHEPIEMLVADNARR